MEGMEARPKGPELAEEVDFAEAFALLMTRLQHMGSDKGSSELEKQAMLLHVRELENICWVQSARLREDAQSQVHRAARCVVLREQADALEAEASTWKLLRYLLFDELSHFPSVLEKSDSSRHPPEATSVLGDGITPLGSGGQRTTRQVVAEVIQADPTLRRVAQVVAWLESLARRDLRKMEAANVGPLASGSYVYGDGLWRETSLAMRDAARGPSLVSQLDPDAPSRQDRHLDDDNRLGEERLLGDVFRLLRAGMHREAGKLLRTAGQPFRAALLAGGGPTGPTPVGHSLRALLVSPDEAQRAQEEALVEDVEGGEGAGRFGWRVACREAAVRLGNEAADTPAASYESAIFGLLSGSMEHILPRCDSWEDFCWAVFRCWLEVRVDECLRQRMGPASAPFAWPDREMVASSPRSFVEALARVDDLSEGLRKREGPLAVYRRLQELVILSEVAPNPDRPQADCLVTVLHSEARSVARWAREMATEEPDMQLAFSGSLVPWGLLRFACHALLLVQRQARPGEVPREPLCAALTAYAAHLTENDRWALAPRYLAQVPDGALRLQNFVALIEHKGLELASEGPVARQLYEACRLELEHVPLDGCAMFDVLRFLAQKSHESLINGPLRKIRALSWLLMEWERTRQNEVAAFTLRHLCRLARDLSISMQSAITSTVEQVTRERLCTGQGSIFSQVVHSRAEVPPELASEATDWSLYYSYLDALASWVQQSIEAAAGSSPANDSVKWAALPRSVRGQLAASGQEALDLAAGVLQGGWLGGAMSSASLDERLAVTVVVTPCSSSGRDFMGVAPSEAGEHPTTPLVDLEHAEGVARALEEHLALGYGSQGLQVRVAPMRDDDVIGSVAFSVDLEVPGSGPHDLATLADAVHSLLESQPDVYPNSTRTRHHVFYLSSSPAWLATEIARRRLVRDVLGSAARIRSQLAALDYFAVEDLEAHGALLVGAASGSHQQGHYAVVTPSDATELLEAERMAGITLLRG